MPNLLICIGIAITILAHGTGHPLPTEIVGWITIAALAIRFISWGLQHDRSRLERPTATSSRPGSGDLTTQTHLLVQPTDPPGSTRTLRRFRPEHARAPGRLALPADNPTARRTLREHLRVLHATAPSAATDQARYEVILLERLFEMGSLSAAAFRLRQANIEGSSFNNEAFTAATIALERRIRQVSDDVDTQP